MFAKLFVVPLLHKNEYGVVPPATLTIAVPSDPELQLTADVRIEVIDNATGWVIVKFDVSVHRLLSTTST